MKKTFSLSFIILFIGHMAHANDGRVTISECNTIGENSNNLDSIVQMNAAYGQSANSFSHASDYNNYDNLQEKINTHLLNGILLKQEFDSCREALSAQKQAYDLKLEQEEINTRAQLQTISVEQTRDIIEKCSETDTAFFLDQVLKKHYQQHSPVRRYNLPEESQKPLFRLLPRHQMQGVQLTQADIEFTDDLFKGLSLLNLDVPAEGFLSLSQPMTVIASAFNKHYERTQSCVGMDRAVKGLWNSYIPKAAINAVAFDTIYKNLSDSSGSEIVDDVQVNQAIASNNNRQTNEVKGDPILEELFPSRIGGVNSVNVE